MTLNVFRKKLRDESAKQSHKKVIRFKMIDFLFIYFFFCSYFLNFYYYKFRICFDWFGLGYKIYPHTNEQRPQKKKKTITPSNFPLFISLSLTNQVLFFFLITRGFSLFFLFLFGRRLKDFFFVVLVIDKWWTCERFNWNCTFYTKQKIKTNQFWNYRGNIKLFVNKITNS